MTSHNTVKKERKYFHVIISFQTRDGNFVKDRARIARQAGDDTNDKKYLKKKYYF
jgi:hypothetical protein